MSKTDVLIKIIRQMGVLRPRDLDAHGIPRQYLRLATDQGLVQRIGRGLYVAPDSEPTEHHSIVGAAKRVPRGVVCLLSALRFHDLTTQSPHEVWIAIGEKSRLPQTDHPPLHVVRFSQSSLHYGVLKQKIEGVPVQVFDPAKTVADCFKYRNKIGLDVAIEALRDSRRKKKASMDELWQAAKVCRVARVMQPYMESIS
jgi:predicted transcriptional regulator of viral defense system